MKKEMMRKIKSAFVLTLALVLTCSVFYGHDMLVKAEPAVHEDITISYTDVSGKVNFKQTAKYDEEAGAYESVTLADGSISIKKIGKYTYEFDGWKVGAGTTLYKGGESVSFTESVTLVPTYKAAVVKYYILNRGLAQPSEIYSYNSSNYSAGVEGKLTAVIESADENYVMNVLTKDLKPGLSKFTDVTIGQYETVKWYVVKTESDGVHVDGIIVPKTFTVTFVDGNGNTLKQETVNGGTPATAPAVPSLGGRDFTGWDKDFSVVGEDITVTAQYAPIPTNNQITYTVTFVDRDGNTLKTQTVNRGTGATAPEVPTVDGFTFTGWDTAFDYVYTNLTVTALYNENPAPAIITTITTIDDTPVPENDEIPEEPEEEPVVIEDEETAQSATINTPSSDEVTIEDEETAQAAGIGKGCWIHWAMLFITALYAIYGVARANNKAKKIKELQGDEENSEQLN